MNGYNRVVLAGNLTRDPEQRYTPSGTAVCKFGLAINRKYTQNGEQKQESTFVDLEAWGKQAETIAQYFKKGSPILIEGRLKLETWEDKQTQQKRSKTVVVVESFTFLDSGRTGSEENREQPTRSERPSPRPSSPVPNDAPPEEDSEVPF